MIILPHRESFIQKNFLELSFDDEGENHADYDQFKKLSSAEQYYLTQLYNWDDGVTVLNWIVDSPKCDKATAKLIFWNSEPDFYLSRNEVVLSNSEREIYNLLKKITEKFTFGGFTRSILKFTPGEKVESLDWKNGYAGWNLSNELKMPSGIFTPISLSGLQLWYFERQRRKRLAKREAKRAKRKK